MARKVAEETNTIKLFNDCSYYNEVTTPPKQFPRTLQSAIQTAITRKGVSVIGLPGSPRRNDRAFRETECSGSIYFQRKNGSAI